MMTYKLTIQDEVLHLHRDQAEVPLTDILTAFAGRRVFALDGPMGAGKTTFTKSLCDAMGTTDVVNSPTFAIVNVYDLQSTSDGGDAAQWGDEIYHFDCYRLKDYTEALDFGAEEYLYSGNYCFIEWPDMIEPLLPEDTVYIHITPLPDGSRQLTIT